MDQSIPTKIVVRHLDLESQIQERVLEGEALQAKWTAMQELLLRGIEAGLYFDNEVRAQRDYVPASRILGIRAFFPAAGKPEWPRRSLLQPTTTAHVVMLAPRDPR